MTQASSSGPDRYEGRSGNEGETMTNDGEEEGEVVPDQGLDPMTPPWLPAESS